MGKEKKERKEKKSKREDRDKSKKRKRHRYSSPSEDSSDEEDRRRRDASKMVRTIWHCKLIVMGREKIFLFKYSAIITKQCIIFPVGKEG